MKIILAGLLLVITACSINNRDSKPIMARSLVSTSDEKISFPITDSGSVNAIEKWIASGDVPQNAVVSCKDSAKSCKGIKALLKKHKIIFSQEVLNEGDSASLALTYSHTNARECDLSHFGCATAGNSLKMITNRQQIVNPSLSEPQDAAGAIRAINKHIK